MYRGVLINESLIGTSILDVLGVLDTEIVEMSAPAAGQPTTWTLHSFEVGDADAAAAAQLLAGQLIDGPWFVDFNNGERSYVVFSSCVSTYVQGDEVTLNAARAHAHERGIPVTFSTRPETALPGAIKCARTSTTNRAQFDRTRRGAPGGRSARPEA